MGGFGLLGEKLAYSFSPRIHKRLAGYEYELYEKAPGEVEKFIKNGAFDGLNVTIPYKKTAMQFCDEVSPEAQEIGCVNTIIRRGDGTLYGDNTDYFGFSYMLTKAGVSADGKKAVVLGSGGASLTVCAVLRDAGAREVVTISRQSGTDNYNNLEKHAEAKIIVNTTPVGMYPENGVSPVRLEVFPDCEAVLDVIYNPAKTELMLRAEDLGITCTGGLYMLAAQAKRAAELFSGNIISDSVIKTITSEIMRETKNIALIGMPGCGKSSVGRHLAELTGREFFDTDDLIVQKAGKSIERIFAKDGEDVFRTLETEVLRGLSARCGVVIATGGGIVKRSANKRLLRQNSVTVFIERDLSELPADGRPLSISQGVEALYNERLPLYKEWSDFAVTARNGADKTAQAVREAVLL